MGTVQFPIRTSLVVLVMALAGLAGSIGAVSHSATRTDPPLPAERFLVDSFNPNVNDAVSALAVQQDGKVLLGGWFTRVGGQDRNRLARVNADGSLDRSFNVAVDGYDVNAFAIQSSGKILVGGSFSKIGGQERNGFARLNPDGTVDSTFGALVGYDSFVSVLVIQPDGKIIVGGRFNEIGGLERSNIARLNADGSVDQDFNPGVSSSDAFDRGTVLAVGLQPDGKIVIGGNFASVAGRQRNNIARLNADGSLDPDFDPNADSPVMAVAVQATGHVILGGLFDQVGGQTRHKIARVNRNGTLDTSFDMIAAASNVSALQVQPDGKIIVAGAFARMGGEPRNGLARLNADGSLDRGFKPVMDDGTTLGNVSAVVVQGNGHIVVGGIFTAVDGQERNNVARISGGAPQALTSISAPRISGTPRVGKKLKATSGKWNVTPDKFTYQWRLDGKVIAKTAELTVPNRARGQLIHLTVTATKVGFTRGTATATVTIR